MKIVMFEFQEDAVALLAKLQQGHDVEFTSQPLTAETVVNFKNTDIISTFNGSDLQKSVLEKLPDLKMIALRHVGFDAIDLAYCRAQGITVCNAPGYGDASIAEHAFALLLDVGKRITESANETRRGNFDYVPSPGFELFGKILGIIGTGHIGRHAAAIGRGFGMKVIAYDLMPNLEEAERIGFQYLPLQDVLAQADVISLHAPGGEGTKGMIDDSAFGLMKQGAVLINTARGSVVDTPALIRALESGKLAAAGLDVLPQEPSLRHLRSLFKGDSLNSQNGQDLVASLAVTSFKNVIVTPHSAYNTVEADERLITIPVDNILAFVSGQAVNIVC